jgi:hypothetical protein
MGVRFTSGTITIIKHLGTRQNNGHVGRYLDQGNASRRAVSIVEADSEQAAAVAAVAAERV